MTRLLPAMLAKFCQVFQSVVSQKDPYVYDSVPHNMTDGWIYINAFQCYYAPHRHLHASEKTSV